MEPQDALQAAGWVLTPLDESRPAVVVLPPPPPLPDAVRIAVDRAWDEAKVARPALFDGRVFSATHVGADRIEGHWTRYRLALAQLRAPPLRAALGVRALAVNGVVETPDGVVVGRRAARAVYQAGLWQCPPAGSVEDRRPSADRDEPAAAAAVDLAAQVMAELHEELGIGANEATVGETLGAVVHPDSLVVDVGFAIRTALDADAVRRRRASRANGEYEALLVAPADRIAARVAALGGTLAPPSALFLGRLASLRGRTAPGSPR